mgnify:CR=1 FL=1
MRWFLLTALIVSSVCLSSGKENDPLLIPDSDDDVPGVGPIRRTDWFRGVWKNRRSSWLKNEKKSDKGGIVFLGDSIISSLVSGFLVEDLLSKYKIINANYKYDSRINPDWLTHLSSLIDNT